MIALKNSLLLAAATMLACGAQAVAQTKPAPEAAAVENSYPGGVSAYLTKFGEPPLGKWTASDRPVYLSGCYRIILLSQTGVRILRLEPVRQPGGGSTWKAVLKEGFPTKPDPTGKTLEPTARMMKRLLDAFVDEELFSLPVKSEELMMGADGQTWIFERWKEGQYRIVSRWSPRGGPARACIDAVMEFVRQCRGEPPGQDGEAPKPGG